jgi:imidazolonepropionase-like amidohydrolase
MVQDVSFEQATIIHAGQLLTRWDTPVRRDQSIIIHDGRVVAISSGFVRIFALDGTKFSDDDPIDLRNFFVLPGLVEGHAHVSYFSKNDVQIDTDTAAVSEVLRNLQALYRKGFTTVRDMGSEIDVFEVRNAIDDALLDAPRLLAAGLRISPSGGPMDRHDTRQENICDRSAQCAEATRFVIGRGADHVKIFASGATPTSLMRPLFSPEALEAIVETATSMDRAIAAHAMGDSAVLMASAAGVTTIEHGYFISQRGAAGLESKGTVLVPTMSPLVGTWVPAAEMDPPGLPEELVALVSTQSPSTNHLRYAVQTGVPIMFGSDVAGEAIYADSREPQYMAEWGGMSPRGILQSATTTPAKVMGLGSEIGEINPGYAADIIAVRHDPTNQPIDLADIVFVMGRGRVFLSPDE